MNELVIVENNEGKNNAICSYRISGDNEISKYLLWKLESEEDIKEKALECDNVIKHTEGKEIVKVIVIKGKIVNVVVK